MTFPQIVAKLIINELLPRLKRKGIEIKDSPISPEDMRHLALARTLGISTHEIRKIMDRYI